MSREYRRHVNTRKQPILIQYFIDFFSPFRYIDANTMWFKYWRYGRRPTSNGFCSHLHDLRSSFWLPGRPLFTQVLLISSHVLFIALLFTFNSFRLIMAGGIFIWSLTTLLGSYMTTFWGFLVMRALVGVGEASYSTIAPTIISDLFVGDTRSKFLALFYFAIPVGR